MPLLNLALTRSYGGTIYLQADPMQPFQVKRADVGSHSTL